MASTPQQRKSITIADDIIDSSPAMPARIPESPAGRPEMGVQSSPGLSEVPSPLHPGAKRTFQESEESSEHGEDVSMRPAQRTSFAQGQPRLLSGFVPQQPQPRKPVFQDNVARQHSVASSQTPSPSVSNGAIPAQWRDATRPVAPGSGMAPVQQMHQYVQGYAYNGNMPQQRAPGSPAQGVYYGQSMRPMPQQMPVYRNAGNGVPYQQQAPHQQKRPVQSTPRATSSQNFMQPMPKSLSEYHPGSPAQQQLTPDQQYLMQQQRQQLYNQQQEAASRLKGFFPQVPANLIYHALAQCRGHMEDASALLADPAFCAQPIPQQTPYQRVPMPYGYQQQLQQQQQQQHQQQHYMASQQSSKRDLKAPTLSVREKYAIRSTQGGPGAPPPPAGVGYSYPAWQHQQPYQQQQRTGRILQRPPGFKPREEYQPAQYTPPQLRKRTAKARAIDVSDESADEDHVELESEPEEDDDDDGDSDEGGLANESSYVPIDLDQVELENKVLEYINQVESAKELADLGSCPSGFAETVIEARPFTSLDEVRALDVAAAETTNKRTRGQRKTAGAKMVDASVGTWEGYEAIDELVRRCVSYGSTLKEAMASWGIQVKEGDSAGALEIAKIDVKVDDEKNDLLYLKDQPKLIPQDVRLKDYQIFGVNWLHLMYQKRLSGILADEMGLGKTCQVISFLGVLLERDIPGPHLIVVPASTLENWLRELTRFCPSLKVEPYYGSQRERADFRDAFELKPSAYNVMVTTYQLAAGAKEDRSFLRKQKFDVCVYDEGHNLKNSASARYNYLMALPARFRLLLTGTPLQNNLKELISLLAFVLPMVFHGNLEKLNAIFKIKAFSGESKEVALLSQQRIDRAKQMMTPFVLRRYKNQVLDDMPAKHYRTDTIELDPLQREIYDDLVAATRKAIEAKAVEEGKDLTELISTKNDNILMQLRKVSNHPMLFRKRYDDGALDKLAKALLKEQFFIDQGSEYGLLIEDMQVMSDYELNRLCKQYEKTQKFALVGEPWMEACKVSHLQRLIPEMRERGDRILLFSQFTQTLDILEDVLNTMNVSFFRLDGSTDVAKRQDMIDQFYEEEDVTVFLLSTKAGGFGINLACANVVIIYDSSYNPHDDKQAEDRAHRVGQKREVNIIRLVCKGTIEEDIQALAQTKLMLDMNVSGTGGTEAAEKTEAQVAQKLLSGLIKADKESTAAPESSSVSVDAGSIKDVKVEEMTSKPASVKSAGSSPLSSVGST